MIPDLNKIKFTKIHRKKRLIRLNKGNKGRLLSNYGFGMILKEKAVITARHLEAVRKLIVRKLKGKSNKNQRNLKIIKSQTKVIKKQKRKKLANHNFNFRRNYSLGLTKKPLQVRMGKGKGNPVDWVYPCASHRVLLEFSLTRAKKNKVKKILAKASEKLPATTKFIANRTKNSKYLRFSKNKIKCIKGL